jgi:outer membrane protein TolC
LSDQIPMLTAEATLLSARQQMAALVAGTAVERVTLLLSVGGGFTPPAGMVAENASSPQPSSSDEREKGTAP